VSEVDPVFGCVLATGRKDRDGYAFHGKTRAHIVAWEAVNGPVPAGMVLDHGCRRRACAAVHHLEAVTQSENEKRKRFAYLVKRKTCQRGHDMGLNRIITPERGVVCRQCNREAR
jgi:hypothetical protein